MSKNTKELSSSQINELLNILKDRFDKHMNRHKALKWDSVQEKLGTHTDKLWSLNEMERTGGEPDVVDFDTKTSEYIFYDCAPETPTGRRNVCYDPEALAARKINKPQDSALGMVEAMGIELLTEKQYRQLQLIEAFDTKTSSWIHTPEDIRKLGGALFADRRYGNVFVYHNGAGSYYGVRGFRGRLHV